MRGQFCYFCGQNQKSINRFFWTLINEAFDDLFSFDSKLSRTIVPLLFRPGFLTVEYFQGRRARYLPPLRLYIITSIAFFFFISLSGGQDELRYHADDTAKTWHERTVEDSEGNLHEKPDSETADESTWDVNTLEDFERELDENLPRFKFNWLTREQNIEMQSVVREQALKAYKIAEDEPARLVRIVVDLAPPLMFLLLPVFALFLKLFYLGSGRYYTEHLLLAIHNHSFLFITLLATKALDGLEELPLGFIFTSLSTAASIWIPIYMYLSLRRFFEQSRGVTMLKFLLLQFFYFVLLNFAIAIAALWGLLTL